MDKTTLSVFARAILTATEGHGRWRVFGSGDTFEKINNPLGGLRVGDVVFGYDTDEFEIKEITVAAVVDGVSYHCQACSESGPHLYPIADDEWAVTKEGAVALSRGEIEQDIAYLKQYVMDLANLNALLK
jgi:hypothetical protein